MNKTTLASRNTEIQAVLTRWTKESFLNSKSSGGVLIGELALSCYVTHSRSADGIDLLFLGNMDIPENLPGFVRVGPSIQKDKLTKTEIHEFTPASLNVMDLVVHKVFDTAVMSKEGVRIASKEGLIALKLLAAKVPRQRLGSLADVVNLLDGVSEVTTMAGWNLGEMQLEDLELCKQAHTKG